MLATSSNSPLIHTDMQRYDVSGSTAIRSENGKYQHKYWKRTNTNIQHTNIHTAEYVYKSSSEFQITTATTTAHTGASDAMTRSSSSSSPAPASPSFAGCLAFGIIYATNWHSDCRWKSELVLTDTHTHTRWHSHKAQATANHIANQIGCHFHISPFYHDPVDLKPPN